MRIGEAMIGRNGGGEVIFASNLSREKFERALCRPPVNGHWVTAAYQSWRETGIRPEPMPAWRERQIHALMRDAPEPLWWGAVIRPSTWVLAFIAVAVVAYTLGAAHGFADGLAIVGLR